MEAADILCGLSSWKLIGVSGVSTGLSLVRRRRLPYHWLTSAATVTRSGVGKALLQSVQSTSKRMSVLGIDHPA